MQLDSLLVRFLNRAILVGDQREIIRSILDGTRVDAVLQRIDALIAANGASPVVRRGRFEWHYAAPLDKTRFAVGEHIAIGDRPINGCSIAAVDGSQIFPDSRDRYPFGLVRIGEIAVNYGSDSRPITRRTIYGPDEMILLEALTGDMTAAERNSLIGGFRDRMEMVHAAKVVTDLEAYGPRVVLVDGPLHPFSPTPSAAEAHDAAIAAIIAQGATPCGVVSGGGDARYTVRLAGMLANVDSDQDWRWVTDRQIWQDLPEGHMSGRFVIMSDYNQTAMHQICFVYARLDDDIVRIEFPANAPKWRDAIAAIRQDARGFNYPYTLLKAHSLAVLHAEERRAYVDQYQTALVAYGLYDDQRSPKELLKEIA